MRRVCNGCLARLQLPHAERLPIGIAQLQHVLGAGAGPPLRGWLPPLPARTRFCSPLSVEGCVPHFMTVHEAPRSSTCSHPHDAQESPCAIHEHGTTHPCGRASYARHRSARDIAQHGKADCVYKHDSL